MGRFALLLVAALGLTGLLANQGVLNQSRLRSARELGTHTHGVVAREVALTGLSDAVGTLFASGQPATLAPVTGRAGGGRYRATFAVTSLRPYEARVRSTSTVTDAAGRPVRYVVEAVYRDGDGLVDVNDPDDVLRRVPPYLRYAVYSDASLRFLLLPRVLSNGPGYNASVHTNGDLGLLLSLQAILGMRAVEGFGTYGGHVNALPILSNPAGVFRPNVNTGLAPTLSRATLPMPELDIPSLRPHATRVEGASLRLLGRTVLGTRERPEIVYVRGDLVLVDTRFEGYGAFIVEGNVIHEGTVTGLLGALVGQPESHVGFYAGGNVLFTGLGDFQGQILANGSVTFGVATTLYGSIAARGSVNFLAAPTIRFVPPSPALTTMLPENPPEAPLRRVSMREWEVPR